MSPRVLIVDDSPANVKILTDILSSAGYKVNAVSGGAEAFARIAVEPPDLVLLDVVMPGMSGYEVCRQLRAHPATALLPVVMVTSLDPRRERVAGIEAGADDFLSRPFNPPELLARTRSLLRIKALQDRTSRQTAELAEWSGKFEARVAERVAHLERLGRLKGLFTGPAAELAPSTDEAIPSRALWPQLLEQLAALGVARSYPRNMVVVSEGDASDSLYVILSGRVKVYVSGEEGREMILAEQGPGEIFGEVGLDERPRSASVATLEPSQLSAIPRSDFRAFCAAHPEMAMMLVDRLIGQVSHLTENVKNLALVDVYGRVARLIMDLAREKEGRLVIEPRPTQQAMAERVGASREMVSRILKDLAAGGYIRMEGAQLVVERQPPRAW
jgi:CRP/FNR family cyclic AMP-dependent transcriptional regulator